MRIVVQWQTIELKGFYVTTTEKTDAVVKRIHKVTE